MNKKEILDEVKRLLFNKPVENKFLDAELVDDTKVRVDGELVADTAVFVVDAEGNETPAPDGEHLLSDEKTLVVTADGKIVEVKEVETEDLQEEVEEKMVEEEVKMEVDESVVTSLVEKVKVLEEMIAVLKAEHEQLMGQKKMFESELSAVKDATVYLAEEFSKSPAGEKIEFKKSGFASLVETKLNSKEEKMNRIKNILNG
jgi:hypothetical protein